MNNGVPIVALPGNDDFFASRLAARLSCPRPPVELHEFPDGETRIRINPEGHYASTLVVASLHDPNPGILPLLFLAATLRDFGADNITLIAPYLAYMRQDRQFRPGEGVSARYFAGLLSDHFDALITVDPHLHRIESLDAVYSIPARVVHAAPDVAAWIQVNVDNPVIVGPDSESEQWVKAVSDMARAPCFVLEKIRRGDQDVEISAPDTARWRSHTPVLVDDIVASAGTMIETVKHLRAAGLNPPVCIAVHGIFAGDALANLRAAGAGPVVSTNSILHETNAIDVSGSVANCVRELSGAAGAGLAQR